METVRVGVIGIGNMGSAHAAHIYDGCVDHMELRAVCDLRQESRDWADKRFNADDPDRVRIYEDYHELIRDQELDAVIIAVPHPLHPILAIEAMECGKHVLTEKPAGIECRSVLRMNEVAQETGVTFGIMLNQRTNPLYQRLREEIQKGTLGEIRKLLWIVNNWYRSAAYYASAGWRARWDTEGGGVLMNQCPHNLDLWQWLIGMPDELEAHLDYGKYHRIDVEDDAILMGHYRNGATAVFITSTGELPGTNRLEIVGSRGKAVVEKGMLTLSLLAEDETRINLEASEAMPTPAITTIEISQDGPEPGHVEILRNFAAAILGKESLLAPGQEGIHTVELINAAYYSDWTGTIARLPVDPEEYETLLRKHQQGAFHDHDSALLTSNYDGLYRNRWQVRW